MLGFIWSMKGCPALTRVSGAATLSRCASASGVACIPTILEHASLFGSQNLGDHLFHFK